MEFNELTNVLEKLGYNAKYFETGNDAKKYVLSSIESGSIIGMGGSVTVNSLGIPQELEKNSCEIYSHRFRPDDDPHKTRMQAINSDYFLCSTNAITKDGVLVNIDGVCNRLAAMCYGPKHIIYIVGKNKFTEDIPSAIKRIKEQACPKNARRLNLSTPCGITGKCHDCNSPQRMCRNTLITEHSPRTADATIILVGEDLGY
ncbi:MAG: lactate utilization protein [Lachnospiraceae bacterium]|nr:lactate utilization protein [Lachnospiraceae bacterium]